MRPKLLFLATEDWFVLSHFAPLVRRAVEDGFETVIAARLDDAAPRLSALGARLIPFDTARGDYKPTTIAASVSATRRIFRAERPDLVHAIALKPIMQTLLASGALAGAAPVLALTGRGQVAVSGQMSVRLGGELLRTLMQRSVRRGIGCLLVENQDDLDWLQQKRPLPADRVAVLPGAGVDIDSFPPTEQPSAPPIRIGLAARLVRSKGVDLAVEATSRLRREGRDAELHIAGAPDADNPDCYPQTVLDTWGATPGVHMHGHVEDMSGFWRGVHIACLPSRGGEGLPRTLIEAAASARPIVATSVAGCRDFVRDGETGLLVSPGDAPALAHALAQLIDDGALRVKLGARARERVEAGYTAAHVADIVSGVWRGALALSRARKT